MIARLFRRNRPDRAVGTLYIGLVEQSRRPEFYLHCGVPDSVDGRFDMVLLHAFLVLRRLRDDAARTEAFAQALFDHMFADMDVNLREMGAGDLSVGKKVKFMAQAFYGRAAAYEEGLRAPPGGVLADALRRNLYGTTTPVPGQVVAMESYLRRESAALADAPVEPLLGGRVAFGPPPAAADAG